MILDFRQRLLCEGFEVGVRAVFDLILVERGVRLLLGDLAAHVLNVETRTLVSLKG